MNTRIPLKDFGPAAPFERQLRAVGHEFAAFMNRETPMTADEMAALSGRPRRACLQIASAMVRDGQANFVSPELGWVLV